MGLEVECKSTPNKACDDLGGEFCEPDYQKDVY